MRNAEPDSVNDANRAHSRRSLSMWRDEHRGTMRINVEVPIEQGELLEKALNRAVEAGTSDDMEMADDCWQALQADALVAIARDYLTGGNGEHSASALDHYQVVIHTDNTALTQGEGCSDLPIETARRLSCDGSVIHMTNGPDAEPLSVGRRQ